MLVVIVITCLLILEVLHLRVSLELIRIFLHIIPWLILFNLLKVEPLLKVRKVNKGQQVLVVALVIKDRKVKQVIKVQHPLFKAQRVISCLLYTSDAADE